MPDKTSLRAKSSVISAEAFRDSFRDFRGDGLYGRLIVLSFAGGYGEKGDVGVKEQTVGEGRVEQTRKDVAAAVAHEYHVGSLGTGRGEPVYISERIAL